MNISSIKKGFYSEDCATECEKAINKILREEIGQIVQNFYREGKFLTIEFYPNTDANEGDFFSNYWNGFEAGYKTAHHNFY